MKTYKVGQRVDLGSLGKGTITAVRKWDPSKMLKSQERSILKQANQTMDIKMDDGSTVGTFDIMIGRKLKVKRTGAGK